MQQGQRSTYARRRWGPAGLGSGAGSRRARTARTVGRWCCVDSPRTRRRSRCPSSCTRPGRSGTTRRAGCTRTLGKRSGVLEVLALNMCIKIAVQVVHWSGGMLAEDRQNARCTGMRKVRILLPETRKMFNAKSDEREGRVNSCELGALVLLQA